MRIVLIIKWIYALKYSYERDALCDIRTAHERESIISSCFAFGNFISSSSNSFMLCVWKTDIFAYRGCSVDLIRAFFSHVGDTSCIVKNVFLILICFRISSASIFWYCTVSIHTDNGLYCIATLNTLFIISSGSILPCRISNIYIWLFWFIHIVTIAVLSASCFWLIAGSTKVYILKLLGAVC